MPKKRRSIPEEEVPLAIKPLEWVVPLETKSFYATNMVVQQGESGEFVISFFQTQKPVILGSPKEQQRVWEAIESIKAVCVARVTVAPDKFEGFADLMANMAKRAKPR